MLQKFWQWLKNLWKRLFSKSASSSETAKTSSAETSEETRDSSVSLSDTDLEFMFNQLLEGVANGWQRQRVERFFTQVEDRVKYTDWIDWLKRFGQRVLSSPQPNQELAKRLYLVALHTQNIPLYMEVGALSNAISQELQRRMAKGEVWEYVGPDADGTVPQNVVNPQENQQVQTFTLEELHDKMKEDEQLRSAIAKQVGVESDDPMVILQALTQQIQQQQ